MDGVCAIGVDVGGTKTAAGIVLPTGALVAKRSTPTQPARGGNAVLTDVLTLTDALMREAKVLGLKVLGLGVCVPELVDLAGTITSGHTIDWRDIEVRSRLEQLAPSFIESDVRAAALGEAMFGAGRSLNTFAYVSVGTGISYTLVQAGIPYAGARGNALILGSAPLTLRCSQCGEETRYVLEETASGPALAASYGAASGEEVTEAAQQGDPAARTIVTNAGRSLGTIVGFLVNLIDPEAIIVGGGLGLSGGAYWSSFVASVGEHIWAENARDLPILRAALGSDVGVVGAAARILRSS